MPQGIPVCDKFKELHIPDFIITLAPRNNCLTINGDVVLVRNILSIESKFSIVYQRFCDQSSFFVYPVRSDFLGIYRVWNLDSEFRIGPVDDIASKNVIMPHKECFVVVPLIHSK